jgi:hypothetical protein
MNDEQKDMTIRILDDRYDGTVGTGDVYAYLKPSEGKVF